MHHACIILSSASASLISIQASICELQRGQKCAAILLLLQMHHRFCCGPCCCIHMKTCVSPAHENSMEHKNILIVTIPYKGSSCYVCPVVDVIVRERPRFPFKSESKCPPALVVTCKPNIAGLLQVCSSAVPNNEHCFIPFPVKLWSRLLLNFWAGRAVCLFWGGCPSRF